MAAASTSQSLPRVLQGLAQPRAPSACPGRGHAPVGLWAGLAATNTLGVPIPGAPEHVLVGPTRLQHSLLPLINDSLAQPSSPWKRAFPSAQLELKT